MASEINHPLMVNCPIGARKVRLGLLLFVLQMLLLLLGHSLLVECRVVCQWKNLEANEFYRYSMVILWLFYNSIGILYPKPIAKSAWVRLGQAQITSGQPKWSCSSVCVSWMVCTSTEGIGNGANTLGPATIPSWLGDHQLLCWPHFFGSNISQSPGMW